jgi:hypothetical protein
MRPLEIEDIIDITCREKMCEWTYRVYTSIQTEGSSPLAIPWTRFIDDAAATEIKLR